MPSPRATPARAPNLQVLGRALQIAFASCEALVVFAWTSVRQGRNLRGALPRAAGRALRRACIRLGPTAIKIGQIASTRGDLLPPSLIEELAQLRDQVPAFDFAEVRRILAEDLGRPPEEIFEGLEAVPVAAASVAQVHAATLRATGERVALKIRRPGILAQAELDRLLLSRVAGLLERCLPSLRLVDLSGAIASFCGAVEEQIHLSHEAANNRRFAANFSDDPDICFPRLFPKLCTDRVLVMEFVDAIHERDLEASELDVRAVVAAGMRCVCRMIFLHGFVHADLHPGNLRFRAPAQVILLDLGLVGRLADFDRLNTARMLFAFATGDGPTVARIFHENSPHQATPDYAIYEKEISDFVEDMRRRGLGNVQLTLEIGRIFDILRRHHIQARAELTMVNLALMTAEGLGKRLAPELSLADEALPYLAEALQGSVKQPSAAG